MKNLILFVLTGLLVTTSFGQRRKKSMPATPPATTAEARWAGFEQRQKLSDNSLVNTIDFRNVGPTVMSGRVVDLEVDPSDPTHFYVAYASGGLWETRNEGASFTPIFDNEIVMTIGDIAVDWSQNVIYVGSGENNSSRSSYSGYGIFKSANNGESWELLGLKDSHHIGRILIHPENSNILWVASLGHLYSENAERGLYKSTDGGKTWNQTLFVDNRTGIIELVQNPEDPDVLIAAAWEKDRKAWDFVEAGPGSGLYRSEDGGDTWVNISEGDSGFPDTNGTGRIGLAYAPDNTVYAILDNQDRRAPDPDEEQEAVTKDLLRTISKDDFLALDNKDLNDYLDRRYFPRAYNAVDIKKDVEAGTVQPLDLVTYVEDANSMLFDTPVKGGEVYKSTDGGNSWVKTHEKYIESLIYSYGYYFGQIRFNPSNPDQLYILGVPVLRSDDGGANWISINGDNVHADHHALWINPENPGHLILGNDGGINISKDNGTTWIKCNSLPVGQFYSVNFDFDVPYNVYGGLQDNGVWKGPSTYDFSDEWHGEGAYPYQALMGGDGMQVQIDSRNNNTVYTGFQFGNYYRIDVEGDEEVRITPRHTLGEPPFRWNWQSPILLSPHNQDIVYFGSNRFHRSMDRGDNFETLSGDLTQGGKKGDVAFGTLTSISESPLQFGLIYVGSDDGLIHRSDDAGTTWNPVSEPLPPNYWISRVQASLHETDRVYASLNGYRWDDFQALCYVSEDRGSTWNQIGRDLPAEPVNVIKEDPVNPNVLYVGTDHGTYVSLDRGNSFMTLGNMPKVAVHDLAVHPRENELIVGTHGRSIFIGDISLVQALTEDVLAKPLHAFAIPRETYRTDWGGKYWTWGEVNEPSSAICYYAGATGEGTVEIRQEESVLRTIPLTATRGLNFIDYDLSIEDAASESYGKSLDAQWAEEFEAAENDKTYLRPGTFTVRITLNGSTVEQELVVAEPRQRTPRKGSE